MNKSSVGSNLVQAKPRFSAQPAQAAQKKSQIYTRVGYRLQLFTIKIFCALKKMAHLLYSIIASASPGKTAFFSPASLGSPKKVADLYQSRVLATTFYNKIFLYA